jgi:hypothetical protein
MDIDPNEIRMAIYNYALETREDINRTIFNLEVLIEGMPPAFLLGPIGETLVSAHRHLEMFGKMFGEVGNLDDRYPELMDKMMKDIQEGKN